MPFLVSPRILAAPTLLVAVSLSAGCLIPPPADATRADLADAYLALESALASNPPADADRASVNQKFDQSTLAFFGGRFAEVINGIQRLRLTIAPPTDSESAAFVASLKLSVDPPIVIGVDSTGTPTTGDSKGDVRVRIRSLYAVLAGGTKRDLHLSLQSVTGESVWERTIKMRLDAVGYLDTELGIARAELPSRIGAYRFVSRVNGQSAPTARRWFVVDERLDRRRARNITALSQVAASTDALASAIAACRSRNDLLADEPAEEISAQFLADYATLPGEINAEIAALQRGDDPYRNRGGDYWRTIRSAAGTAIPIRVYAPASVVNAGGPMPLLITLHGAGGDENMFFDGYGAGRIKSLADDKRFLVVAPESTAFLRSPENFDALLTDLGHTYNLDRERIYVLGHSLGAIAVSSLAETRMAEIAAACCISGFNGRSQPLAPTLVLAGTLDPISRIDAVKSRIAKSTAAGSTVELRELANYGHTLIVGAVLSDAVDWLLAHRLKH